MPEQGEHVLTPGRVVVPGGWVPTLSRFEGSGWVNVLGTVPLGMTAEQAIALGHTLVEAGLGARRTDA